MVKSVDFSDDFFPQGLALGANFCNRTLEKRRVKENVNTARSTLVMSPRRYGKTSLVLEVLRGMEIPFAHIDLFSELNEEEVQNTILSAIGNVLYATESTPKKALSVVTQFFSDLSVGFKFANAQMRIDFSRSHKPAAKTILEALQRLDNTLKAKKKRTALFFDEFQRLNQITESATIEGALRHVAQESKNIAFIFSGSNRHLLSNMFDDRTKPLYKLCDRLVLERISHREYAPFIKEKSSQQWKSEISDDSVETILTLTQKHPYYVNVLCHRLWLMADSPTAKDVEKSWHKYAMEEKTNIINEINLLSANQAKMLMSIAKYSHIATPMSKAFIALTKFSASSASQALQALEKKDYLSVSEENKYLIVDPLIGYVFSGAIS